MLTYKQIQLNITSNVASCLLKESKERDWNQNEMASHLDMDASVYGRMLRLERYAGIQDIYHIHNRLGIDVNLLFENVDSSEEEVQTVHNGSVDSIDEMILILKKLVSTLPAQKQAYINMLIANEFNGAALKNLEKEH